MNTISQNRLFVFCLAYSLLALIISFFSEIIWKIQPCYLCNLARLFFIFLSGLSFLGVFLLNKETPWKLLSFALILGLILSLYHSLITLGFFEKASCLIENAPTSKDDYLYFLESHVSCSKQELYFWGIPAVFWNLCFCSFVLWKQFNTSSFKRFKT